ncbi:integrase core domain protein, partial [Trichuris suis]
LASDSEDEHFALLQKLFQRFKAYGVRINPAKCTLAAQSLTFLGHQIDKNGVSPSPDKVEAIRAFPTPTTTKQLRQFLGMINFYRRFLPNIAVTLAPLDALVSPQCQQITLSPSQLEAFETAKPHDPLSAKKIAIMQAEDPELSSVKQDTSLQLRPQVINDCHLPLWVDVSVSPARIYIPASFRHSVFEATHGLSHPGVRATKRLILTRYVWPGVKRDVARWTASCIPCQRSKVHRHTRSPPVEFPLPGTRFEHVHLDIVGPLPPSENKQYLLTAVDRFSRWPEAWPVAEISAKTIARTFLEGWISRFGIPSRITTDRGRQFDSELWASFSKLLGCQHIATSAYHPQSNGLVERFHRQLKSALIAHMHERSPLDGSAPSRFAGPTYGRQRQFFERTANDASDDPFSFANRLKSSMQRLKPVAPRSSMRAPFISKSLKECTHVFLQVAPRPHGLVPLYFGPHAVIKRTDKTITINMDGREATVAIDRTKPAFVDNDKHEASVSNRPRRVIFSQTPTTTSSGGVM